MDEQNKEMCACDGKYCEGVCRTLHRMVPVRDKANKPTGEKRLCTSAFIKSPIRRKRKYEEEAEQKESTRFDERAKYKGLFDY